MSSDLDTEEDKQTLLHPLLAKSDVWVHEREWRAIRIDCRPGLQEFPPDGLTSIYFGARMSKDHREGVLSIIAERAMPIEVFEMRVAPNRYELTRHLIKGG